VNLCTGYLIRVDLRTPLLFSGVFKKKLAIQAQGIITEGILDSSPTLFFEPLDSSST
jgi:hypothetical protein